MTPKHIERRIAKNADTILRTMEGLSKGDTRETIATLLIAAIALARAEQMSFSDFLIPTKIAWNEIHSGNKLENLPWSGKRNPFTGETQSEWKARQESR